MIRKLLFTFILLFISILAFSALNVSATTYGDLTYTVSNGEVTITNCDVSATEVVIPEIIDGCPVTSIGHNAFFGCSSLASITIPDSVTSIDDYAFYGCAGLTMVSITSIEAWCNIEFNNYNSNPLYYAKNLYLNGELVANLVIPDSVTTIGDYAFYGCSSMISITIPDSVTIIGDYAFFRCNSLTKVYITSIKTWCNIKFNNYNSNPLYYAKNLYLNGELIANLVIPDSVTTIGDYAFYHCSSLTSITIPDSVTTIGYQAFRDCNRLTKVYITSIKAWCNIWFNRCYSNPLYYAKNLYLNGKPVTNLVIPDGVTSLNDWVFVGCNSLTSIIIPNSVTSIGRSAFSGCNSLTSITIPNSVTSIGRSAFYDCNSLISIAIPNDVTSIGRSTFYGCRSLINMTIPEGVTSIARSAFRGCSSLSRVTIPDSVTSIGYYAFYNCSKLKHVSLPKESLYINNYAFNGCSNIETIFYAGSEYDWSKIPKNSGNEDLTSKKIVYNAAKKTYKFNTNCDANLPDITEYAVFEAPMVMDDDKILIGWYDNKALSGEPVTFPYYGNATTLYAAWTDKTGLTFDDAFTAKENKEYAITTKESGQIIYYEFVPKFTGEYRFFSKGSLDTCGYLYNSSKNTITSDENGNDENNFRITYNLTAGETYYIGVKLYNGAGTFTLCVETDCRESTTTVCVTAVTGEKIFITIPNYLPDNAQIILACYDNNGGLVEMQSKQNNNETIYFVVSKDFDNAKVMVWEDFINLIPVCDAEIVK